MGQTYERIDGRIREFIDAQPVFFVASAPLAAGGHINLSPKGHQGSLQVLDEQTVAYLDFGGSHAETHAHLRENGRITLMWCAFAGPPKIVRVHDVRASADALRVLAAWQAGMPPAPASADAASRRPTSVPAPGPTSTSLSARLPGGPA